MLADWCARGSSLSDVLSVDSSSSTCSLNGTSVLLGCTAEEGSDPIIEWVQYEDCTKWFTLPEGITSEQLPDVFVCSLRWWDCSLQKIRTGYKDDWCRKGAIKTNLVTKWIHLLQARALEAQDANPLVPGITLEEATQGGQDQTDPLFTGSTQDPMPGDDTSTTEREDALGTQTPRPEGAARSRNKGLSEVCKYTLYLAEWYAAHVGRGKWQEARISAHKEMLQLAKNRGKAAMFTTDMKSKTVPDKHKCEQGYRMGLKGMSLQGGMLNFCNSDGVMQQHYINVVYAQSSNQSLEEAMSGIAAQLDLIQAIYPDIETLWIVSDKCSNFNSFEQIPFIVSGNKRKWVQPQQICGTIKGM